MISYPAFEQVVEDLGDKVIDAFGQAAVDARRDLQTFRGAFPAWVAESSERGLANFIHDRLWSHVVRHTDGIPDVSIVDQEPVREVYVGIRYRLRVKRHQGDGHVSTYPTQSALDFALQQPQLSGLEEVRLMVGYDWDSKQRRIGPAVLSLRDGLDKIRWKRELPEPSTGAVRDMTSPTGPGPTPPVIETPFDAEPGEEEG